MQTPDNPATPLATQATNTPPAPGQYWPEQAGWYIGIICNPINGQAWHLIQPDGDEFAFSSTAWCKEGQLVDGAISIYDGHANTLDMLAAKSPLAKKIRALPGDCYLPSRAEALAMFATAKAKQAPGWHWTSTQDSDNNAWSQYFRNGYQGNNVYKGAKARARAVRRLVIQSFSPLSVEGGAA